MFRSEETGAVAGGARDDAQHPRPAGDRAQSQYGDLPQRQFRRKRCGEIVYLCITVRVLVFYFTFATESNLFVLSLRR